MSFQPGRMGTAEGIALVFITTFTTIFLSGWSLVLDVATTATWMLPLISWAAGILILYLQLYILRHTSGDLYSACQELLGNKAAGLIAVYFIAIFSLDAALLVRQFAESILLTALPELPCDLAVAWNLLVVAIILYSGIEAVARASYMILPMALLAVFTVLALLVPQYEFLYLTPWNGPGLKEVAFAGIRALGVNLGIIIPVILARSFQNSQTVHNAVLYGFSLSSLFKSVALAAYIAAFGTGAGREKILPFYEMARLVYINRYIQRIEALIILLWGIMGILNIAIELYIVLYLLSRLFQLQELKPLIIPVAVIIGQAAMLPAEITGVIMLQNHAHFTVYTVGIISVPLMLAAAVLIKSRSKKTC